MAPSTPREKRIKVCVRIRPFTKNEAIFPAQIPARRADRKSGGGSTTSSIASSRAAAAAATDTANLPSSYSFDYLFPPTSPTQSVYDETGGAAEPGIVQLSVNEIFSHIARHPEMEFLLRFSYLEIYNERIYDLLAAGAKSEVKIFEVARTATASASSSSGAGGRDAGPCKDVIIKGLREEIVVTMEHVLSLVEVGNLHRHMATTESNDQSSRSHVIFRMVIESQHKRSRDRAPTSNGAPISGESVLLRKYRARIRELEEQLESLQRRKSGVGVGARGGGGSAGAGGGAQASVNLSTIEERQMELQFAINNINRVILNSGAQQQVAEAAMVVPAPVPVPPASQQLRGRPRPPEIKTQGEPVGVPETPDDANNEPDEEEDDDEGATSRTNSNRTLIGSGGSRASTKTLPLSSSSSLPTTDGGDFEPKDMIIGEEPEDEEQADAAGGQQLQPQSRQLLQHQQQQQPQRMSLTTMLRSKYQDEITRMEQRAGRWSLRPDDEVQPQQDLLKEFVRGLEIAEAEQETRMSKIQELELANRQLRQILAAREEELMHLKNTRPENETL
ncbi:hypothetical protein PybrP1_010464 [[Pythium] brassicae (nom. inval.)]|nr:hypothetical protein PybrP1_010464 [[Pythium] brassicae (nom. inval.)]